jgi:hypothetical protein
MLTGTRMKWLWIDKEGSRAGAEIMMRLPDQSLELIRIFLEAKYYFTFIGLQTNIHLVTQSFLVFVDHGLPTRPWES